MNWDTREISMIIESDIYYYTILKSAIKNELHFMLLLYIVIEKWNEKLGEASKHIDTANVNGNEVYISFCEAVGIETQGWNGNETD